MSKLYIASEKVMRAAINAHMHFLQIVPEWS